MTIRDQIIAYLDARQDENAFLRSELADMGSRSGVDQAIRQLINEAVLGRAGVGILIRVRRTRYGTIIPVVSVGRYGREALMKLGINATYSKAIDDYVRGWSDQIPVRDNYALVGNSRTRRKIGFGNDHLLIERKSLDLPQPLQRAENLPEPIEATWQQAAKMLEWRVLQYGEQKRIMQPMLTGLIWLAKPMVRLAYERSDERRVWITRGLTIKVTNRPKNFIVGYGKPIKNREDAIRVLEIVAYSLGDERVRELCEREDVGWFK